MNEMMIIKYDASMQYCDLLLQCCPNLVYGAGDETLYILSASENLWERATEGRRCLDGWEADLS